MALAFTRSPRVAFAAAALTGLVWLNQGPSARRYDALVSVPAADRGAALRAWLPFALAYRRSVDEELYYATANAIRGLPVDRAMLAARRGDVPPEFLRLPPTDGRWHAPYAEVPFEYPAIVLPFVLAPALLSSTFDTFAVLSGALMASLLLGAIAIALHTRSMTQVERARGWWAGAALMLAQGGLAVQRLDAIPALLLAVGLWAAARRRPFAMGLGVGLAAAAKIVPLLALAPMMAADREAWRSRAALGRVAAGVLAALAAGFLPMVALAGRAGLAGFLAYHRARGLHVESTYGTLDALAQLATGDAHPATLSFGSYNLDGDAARWWAAASTPILLAATAALSTWIALRPPPETPEGRAGVIACAGLAALATVWLFGKVLSPQYLTWGIPFAVAAPDRRIVPALALAMAIGQVYTRGFYDHVVELRGDGVLALVLRLAALGLLAALVLRALPGGGRRALPAESVP